MNASKNSPLVSIILCTYNGERFLREQIDSIISQGYENKELIISDDASTDSTKDILLSYQHHSFIRFYFNEKNNGFAKNFENASKHAKGEFLAFADQDDVWLPGKIEKLLNAIGSHMIVYSNSRLIDDNGTDLGKKLSDYRSFENVYDSRSLIYMNVVSGHTMMIKKELLQHTFPIPESWYHDWWFAVQAANLSGIKYLDEVLTLYRQHNATVTKTIIVKKVGSRPHSKRYADFLFELKRISAFTNNPLEKHKAFFEKLVSLYKQKENNSYVWALFFFLLKYEKILFRFTAKKYASIFFEIRKMARGEWK